MPTKPRFLGGFPPKTRSVLRNRRGIPRLSGVSSRAHEGETHSMAAMEYRPLAGGPTVPLADGVRAAVGGADVLVLGHSLGSALAECLAYEARRRQFARRRARRGD